MGNESSQYVATGERLENDINITWKKVNTEGIFAARDGHCSCVVGQKLYVFGGVISTNQDDCVESQQLLQFDLETCQWTELQTSGVRPAARSSATMSAVGNKLYLFGGLSRDSGWFNDLHIFDIGKCEWRKVNDEGTGPSPRDKLASSVVDDCIYFCGGFGPRTQDLQDESTAQFGWFDDIFILDTSTLTWSQVEPENDGGPSPRAALTMTTINDRFLVIFGGRDSEGRKNDVHIFDTEANEWIKDQEVTGQAPEPRSFHTMTAVEGRVVVIGGMNSRDQHLNDVHIYDVASHSWLQPGVEGETPEPRGAHTACVVGDQLLLYGGSSQYNPHTRQCTKLYSTLHALNTDDILGRKQASETDVPASRSRSSHRVESEHGDSQTGDSQTCDSQDEPRYSRIDDSDPEEEVKPSRSRRRSSAGNSPQREVRRSRRKSGARSPPQPRRGKSRSRSPL